MSKNTTTPSAPKVNARFFNVLRNRLNNKHITFGTTSRRDLEKFNIEYKKALRRVSKQDLIEFIASNQSIKLFAETLGVEHPDTMHRRNYDDQCKRKTKMLAKIDTAELEYLAGDSDAATRLMVQVDNFLNDNS